MSDIQHAAHLNNVSASMIAVSEGTKAIDTLFQALAIVESGGSAAHLCAKEDPAKAKLFPSECQRAVSSAPKITQQHKKYPLASIEGPKFEESNFYIYHRPVLFFPDDTVYTYLDQAIYSAVIMFNIALCLHKNGQNTCKIALLRNASIFYTRCIDMMKYAPTNTFDCTMLLAAAINNKAQIHDVFFDDEIVHELLQNLRCTLLYMKYVMSATKPVGFNNEQMNELNMNLCLFSNRKCCGSPAA